MKPHYLLKREDFLCELNMEDADYVHTKTVCKFFEIKNLFMRIS